MKKWLVLALATVIAATISALLYRAHRWRGGMLRDRGRWCAVAHVLLAFALAGLAAMADWDVRNCYRRPSVQQPGTLHIYYGSPPILAGVCILVAIAIAGVFSIWANRKLALATVVSLLLLAIVITGWIRSSAGAEDFMLISRIKRADHLIYEQRWLSSNSGGIQLAIRRNSDSPQTAKDYAGRLNPEAYWGRNFNLRYYPYGFETRFYGPPTTFWKRLGFELKYVQTKSYLDPKFTPTRDASVTFPYWVLLVPLLGFPLLWAFRRSRLLLRRVRGQCSACGYDLRASIQRCPECGTVLHTKSTDRDDEVTPDARGDVIPDA